MKTYLKAMLMTAAVAGLYVPTTAFAQKSAGGVTGEARLHPGTWGNQRASRSYGRSYARSRPMYRSTAPVIVRTERTPDAVAQAPAERRSFSYEPSQRADNSVDRETVIRSESAPRRYIAPRMRSSNRSQLPLYLGPKAESNNYRN
jgi:hypothetical protein